MNQGIVIPQIDPTTVTYPASGYISIVANLSGQLTVISPTGVISPLFNGIPNSYQVANSSAAGNTIVGPGNGVLTFVGNITGVATGGARTFCLSTSGLSTTNAGYRITVLFNFSGQPSGISLLVYNGATSGALLFSFATDGLQNTAAADFYFDGTAWQIDNAKVPAIT